MILEVAHQLLHLLGFCPEVIALGVAHTPQMVLQFAVSYIKLKLNI